MNPLGIFALVVGLVMGYYVFTTTDLLSFGSFRGFGSGPLATGPGRGAEVENPQPVSRGFFGFGAAPSAEPQAAPRPGESPLKGKVRIADVHRSGISPHEEYVTIRYGGGLFGFSQSSGEPPVDVTGWRVASRRTIGTIPRAYNIPEIDSVEQDVMLPPGGELIVVTGTPSYQSNFRENNCVGYLNEFHSFTPSLSNSCADANPDRGRLLNRGFNGACIETIEDVATCRMPKGPFQAGVIGRECIDYLNQNLSYAGCVKNFRDRGNFLGNAWRVSLKLSAKMFDPLHDRAVLRDQNGLLVDEFEY